MKAKLVSSTFWSILFYYNELIAKFKSVRKATVILLKENHTIFRMGNFFPRGNFKVYFAGNLII